MARARKKLYKTKVVKKSVAEARTVAKRLEKARRPEEVEGTGKSMPAAKDPGGGKE